jgi:hypothetical protein
LLGVGKVNLTSFSVAYLRKSCTVSLLRRPPPQTDTKTWIMALKSANEHTSDLEKKYIGALASVGMQS